MLEIVCLIGTDPSVEPLSHVTAQAIEYGTLPARISLCTSELLDVLRFARDIRGDAAYLLDVDQLDGDLCPTLCRRILSMHPEGYVILVSGAAEQLFRRRTHAFDFLPRPLTRESVAACLADVAEDVRRRRPGLSLTVSLGSHTILLDQQKIIYLSKERNNMVACTTNGEYRWRNSFTEIEKYLRPGLFVRVHRRYVCSLRHMADVDWGADRITMDNGDVVELSRRLENELRKAIFAYHA